MESRIVSICRRYADDRTRLMDILLEVQRELRGIEPAAMELIARQLGITRVEVEGVVSFYAFFSRRTKGEIIIRVCDDIIDRHAGGGEIAKVFMEELGLAIGTTSADGRFSLEITPFLGMSDQAPSAMVNETILTRLTAQKVRLVCARLREGTEPRDLVVHTGDGNNSHPLIRAEVNNNIRLAGEVLLCPVPANAGLRSALQRRPQELLAELEESGLTGRGGAGFPTG
ncbi:MAG: NAD(P)H-dependent oxidoreductase subunit E, partial [Gammaproteobacteria bacterium]|nr:NAD(P)H-dependent oxidoreductase subunit E [Gammaproteobacteria bacterium]